MTNIHKFKNPIIAEPVILSGIDNNNIQEGESIEPQMIRIRSQNTSYLYVNSNDINKKSTSAKAEILLGGPNVGFSKIGVKRISLVIFEFFMTTPNVNERNNEVIVEWKDPVVTKTATVTVPEGYYDDSKDLMDALVLALNTEFTLQGSAFQLSVTANPLSVSDGSAILYKMEQSAGPVGSTFKFLESSGTNFGRPLWNLPNPDFDVFSSSKTIGPVFLYYTRFIDVRSSVLTQFSKNENVTGKTGNTDVLLRIFLQGRKLGSQTRIIKNPVTFNFSPKYQLKSFDVSLHDEFDNLLYLPRFKNNPDTYEIPDGTNGSFWWNMGIKLET